MVFKTEDWRPKMEDGRKKKFSQIKAQIYADENLEL